MRFPEGAILLDPGCGALHGLCGEVTAVDAPIHFALKKAGGFEDPKVFGDGGKRDAKRLGELGNHSCALREAGEDGSSRRIGKSAERGVERQGGIFNHLV